MEKRVVFFLVLSLLIIFGWNYFLDQMGWLPEPPSSQDSVLEDQSPSRGKGEEVSRTPPPPSSEPPPPVPTPSPSQGEPDAAINPVDETPFAETVHVETDLYRAEFSTKGAVITSWTLTQYTNPTPDGPKPVQLVYQEGQFKKPLSVLVEDESVTKRLSTGIYQVSRDFSVLSESKPTGHLTFSFFDKESGVRLEKVLTFHFDTYVVDIAIHTTGIPKQFDVSLGTNFGIVEWGEGFIGLVGPAYLIGEELEKETPEQVLEKKGDVRWVALQDKYFISVFLPQETESIVLTKEGEKLVSAKSRFVGSTQASLQLFAGPKQYNHLTSLNVGLENTIDFGWFIYGSWDIVRAVAEPLFSILRFFYGYTHNYGIAIICVTVLIKLLFVPLQYKSYKSMKDMQVIQPKVLELQKKLKDDKERLNRELIKLYRDHKVNPVGGCLPMILQMPVFIALFNILYMTIDLRQAPIRIMDSRPFHPRSLLCVANLDGNEHGDSTKNHADNHGSHTGQNDAHPSGVLDIYLFEFCLRACLVLVDQQRSDDYPAICYGSVYL